MSTSITPQEFISKRKRAEARDLEKELGRDALCPIALGDGLKSSRWLSRNGLDLFYKKAE